MTTSKKDEKKPAKRRDTTKRSDETTTETRAKKTVKKRVEPAQEETPRQKQARAQAILKQETIKVLRISLGIVSAACEKVGISRQTFYRWKREDQEFAAAVDDVEERALDIVESYLFNGIKAGDSRLIIYYLNNKGRKRGYGVRSPIEDVRNNSITLKISEEESEY